MELVDNFYQPSQLDRFTERRTAQGLIDPKPELALVPPHPCACIKQFNGKHLVQLNEEAMKVYEDFSRFLISFSWPRPYRGKLQGLRISLAPMSQSFKNQGITAPHRFFFQSSYVLYDLFALLMLIRSGRDVSGWTADDQESFR